MLSLLLAFLAALLLALAIVHFGRNLVSAYGFLLALFATFFLFPTFIWFVGRDILPYALEGRAASRMQGQLVEEAALFTCMFGLAFATVSVISLFISTKKKIILPHFHAFRPGIIHCIYIAIAITGIYALSQHDFSIASAFSLRYDEHRAFASYTIQRPFFALGLSIVGVKFLIDGFRFSYTNMALLVFISGFALGTGQRREVFVVLAYCIALYLIALQTKNYSYYRWKQLIKLSAISIFMCGSMLFLWYTRVVLSSNNTVSEVFSHRSPLQVLFGSAATGFPSLNLTMEYFQNREFMILLPAKILTTLIPRAMWPEKPIPLADQMEVDLMLEANPSPFLFGELYAWIGYWSVLATPLISVIVIMLGEVWRRGHPFGVLMSAYAFPATFILFKNGLVSWGVHITMFAVAAITVVLLAGVKGPSRKVPN